MNFIKLHQDGREVLINLSLVSEVYSMDETDMSELCLNFVVCGEQVEIRVDESLDEILELIKQVSQ